MKCDITELRSTVRSFNHVVSHLSFALLLGTIGCIGTFPQAPDELPASLDFAVNNKEVLLENSDWPLMVTERGTAMDSLDTLTGCWGNYLGGDIDASAFEEQANSVGASGASQRLGGIPGFDLALNAYTVMEIDAQTQEITTWVMQEWFGLGTIVAGGKGTFEILNVTRVRETTTHEYSNTLADGRPNPDPDVVLKAISEPYTYEWTATLAGDYLKVWFVDTPNDPPNPDDVMIFRRFDCPAASETP